MNYKGLFSLVIMVFAVVSVMSLSFLVPDTEAPAEVNARRDPPGIENAEINRITESVYAVTGLFHPAGKKAGVSAGIIFTDGAVVFIDAGMTVSTGEYLWRIARERMKGDEELYLVLTHHHSDHVFGMRALEQRGATVLAHELFADELTEGGGRYKELIIAKFGWDREKGDAILGDVVLSTPDALVDGDTVLSAGGEELLILAVPGHEPGELAVYHPGSKTLFAGDAVYSGMTPNVKFGGPDEWRTWISHLERLKRLEIDTICPGHGELCGKDEIDRNIAYLKSLL